MAPIELKVDIEKRKREGAKGPPRLVLTVVKQECFAIASAIIK